MERFLSLPCFKFIPEAIEYAPDESGVYGLFDEDELIYIGLATGLKGFSIRECLLKHLHGAHGECTMRATQYAWELSFWPKAREAEILAAFHERIGRDPRCQQEAA